jgi:hypothetical protein
MKNEREEYGKKCVSFFLSLIEDKEEKEEEQCTSQKGLYMFLFVFSTSSILFVFSCFVFFVFRCVKSGDVRGVLWGNLFFTIGFDLLVIFLFYFILFILWQKLNTHTYIYIYDFFISTSISSSLFPSDSIIQNTWGVFESLYWEYNSSQKRRTIDLPSAEGASPRYGRGVLGSWRVSGMFVCLCVCICVYFFVLWLFNYFFVYYVFFFRQRGLTRMRPG